MRRFTKPALLLFGVVNLIFSKLKIEKMYKIVMELSMGLNILIIIFLAIRREPYPTTMMVLFLVVKGVVLLKRINAGE